MTVSRQSQFAKDLRMILKFDTGRDGFKKMMVVLGIAAALVAGIGIYFLIFIYPDIVKIF